MWRVVALGRREMPSMKFAANRPYRVELTARAIRDLEALYLEKNAAGSPDAARWYNGLERAVYTLETRPNRCPGAPEARKMKRQLRHLLYGVKPHVYRVIFEVDERRHNVWVLTIRHGARKPLKPADLD
jgi:mRNA-degrading endonuclease RelE of RelBE toxin-antitoxin system